MQLPQIIHVVDKYDKTILSIPHVDFATETLGPSWPSHSVAEEFFISFCNIIVLNNVFLFFWRSSPRIH